jgi:hypothetical protein
MKNTTPGLLCWFVLPSLCMCPIAALAQGNIYGNAPTNNYLSQSNNFLSQPVGPSSPGSAPFGGPFMGTSSLSAISEGQSRYLPAGPPLVEWGPFGFYPHLLYLVTYGNGLEAQPGTNSTTVVNTVTPGLFLKIGNVAFIDYTPSFAFYSNPLFRDTTDQRVVFNVSKTNGNWSLNLTQTYIDTTQPLVETGTQIEQEAYATALNAAWQTGDKTSLQLGVNQNFRFTEGLNTLHEWSTSDWFNYQFQPQIGGALGVTGGYDELSLGSDNPFEQVLGRVIFAPGTKLHLIVVGGVEDRQSIHPFAPSFVTPIFQAYGLYQVRDGTSLIITGSRAVAPSLFTNELNVITTVSANLRQTIIGNMSLTVSGGYTDQSYTSIVPGPLPKGYLGPAPTTSLAVVRSDTRTYAQIRLSTVIETRLTASLFYMHTENASSQSKFQYSGNQVGLQLDYRY